MSYRYPNVSYAIADTPMEQPVPPTRYSRTSFTEAGVDNFTRPPGQDPEMLEILENVLPVASSALLRRYGYTFWMNPTSSATHIYDYLSDLTGKREIILTSPTYVRAQNDDGSDYNTNLFTPTVQAGAPRAVTSRSYSFFSDGQAGDYKKWDGSATGGVTKWGIDINDIGSGTTAGPEAPGTATDVGTGAPSGSIGPLSPTTVSSLASGGAVWDTPTNAEAFDGLMATVLVAGGGTSGGDESQLLKATGYNFNIPNTATISGVVAEIWWGETPYVLQNIDSTVVLVVGGTPAGDNKARLTNAHYPYSYIAYGSASDTWGLSLTPSDVNSNTFGVAFGTENITTDSFDGDGNDLGGAGNDYTYVDHMRLTVYYDMPATVASWSFPNNIKVEDGLVATATATTAETSALQGTNFGFTVPGSDAITGIQVSVKCSADAPVQLRLSLMKSGVLYGEVKSHPITNPSLDFLTYGGAADLWSGSWIPGDVNGGNFGVSITALSMSGSINLAIDYVSVTVYLSTGPITLGANTAGSITLTDGRVYFAVFSNSSAVHFSDLTPPSASTGPLTNRDQPISNLPVSVDPQVDTVNLLATADGGDETRLYLVASLPNGTTTYTDSTTEEDLLTQPVLLSTDATGTEFGVSGNAPPPVGGLYPTKHRGRLYLLSGPTLHWSKALEDVTTDTGFVAGRWEESFPPENSADVSEGAENGRGQLSDGINLYIGTEFKIRRLNGDAPFLESPDIVHNEVGIMNQDVWKITYLEGTPVGAMWLTPDLRVISSDFNTYKDVSPEIHGTLGSVNKAAVRGVAYGTFYANGPLDLYILAVPTGVSTVNDTLCVFNLKTQKWFTWKFTDTVASFLYHTLSTGVPQLLIGSDAGPVYYLDSAASSDRVNNTQLPFTVTARTSWLDFGDPTLRKNLNELEASTEDTLLSVLAEGATKLADFQTPHTVINRAVTVSPRGEYKVYLAASTTRDRYYRFTFTSTGTQQNVLGGFSVEHIGVNRQ